MKKYILFIFLLLITISTATAYTTTNIQHYMTSGDALADVSNQSAIYDSHQGYLYYANPARLPTSLVSGIQGNSLRFTTGFTTQWSGANLGNETNLTLENDNFAINYWIKVYGVYSRQGIEFSAFKANTVNQNVALEMNINVSNIRQITQYVYGGSSSVKVLNNTLLNVWNMYTLSYNLTNKQFQLWVNGVDYGLFTAYDLPATIDVVRFKLYDQAIDEILFLQETLNQSEVDSLYNSGVGLNYAETLANADDYTGGNVTEFTYFCYNSTALCNSGYYDDVNATYYCYSGQLEDCALGCAIDNPAYCTGSPPQQANTTLFENAVFSQNQCVVSAGTDYLCTNSIYNNVSNSFLCNIDDIIPCQAGCINHVLDTNNSQFWLYDMTKTCNTIYSDVITGLNMECTLFWTTQSLIASYLQNIFGQTCNSYDNITIPYTYCTDSLTQSEIFTAYPSDTFYTEGQCKVVAGNNQCTLNAYSCADNLNQQKCINDTDTGFTKWNVTKNCGDTKGYQCILGSCIYVSSTNGTGTVVTPTDETLIFGLSISNFLLSILIIGFTFFIFLGAGLMAQDRMGMTFALIGGLILSLIELIYFAFIGWLPAWIVVIVILVSGGIGVVMVRNLFTSGSGGGDGG